MTEAAIQQESAPEIESRHHLTWIQRAGKIAAGLTLISGAGAAAGTMAMPTEVTIGPHRAEVELTLDPRLHLDLGFLGSASMPMPGDHIVGGAHVTLKEVPAGDNTELGATELAQYQRFFTEAGLQSDAEAAAEALAERALHSAGIALALSGFALWAIGAAGRRAIHETGTSRRFKLSTLTIATMTALTASTATNEATPQRQDSNAILEAAGLQDVHVEGKILEAVVYKYGPNAVKYMRDVNAYYQDIGLSLATAYDTKRKQEALSLKPLNQQINQGKTDQILWISDNHCNTGMSQVAGQFARTLNAPFILDTGDATLGGTAAEKPCLSVLPQQAGDTPIVMALGNHDDAAITAAQARSLQYIVLDGKPTLVKGYTIIGEPDVMRSPLNIPFHQVGDVTREEQGARVARASCEAGGVDIMALHEPETVAAATATACAKFIGSGHMHRVIPPKAYSNALGTSGFTMTNGTSGGAAESKVTVGSRLGKDATLTVLIFDKTTHDPLGVRVITIKPDKQVIVGDIQPLQLAEPDVTP
jgi:predicted MPP superfamily phosphohydrolase